MAAHLSHSSSTTTQGLSLRDLPKSNTFTSLLPPDPAYSTSLKSHQTPRHEFTPRPVHSALYTFIRPHPIASPELLATSPAALHTLSISAPTTTTAEFLATVSGNHVLTWDPARPDRGVYPWAQCYGGYQFGHWAGQLGDGRAVSLFEATDPRSGRRFELQLKGAGRTPYSRFADGRAVLRAAVREFVVSEYLAALGVPTTRALSVVLAGGERVVRERAEPVAVVARFAESWVRIGTFDLLRARGERGLLRRLAEYVAVEVYGGWEMLPRAVSQRPGEELGIADVDACYVDVETGAAKDVVEGVGEDAQNRFARLFRAVARNNAKTVAAWQAYGFMNGVLNTDNTSILGLSIDFGPFGFMDTFDPAYTPNHDDDMLRYAYRAQPSVIWWNLLRLGEALGELLGAGPWCDDVEFVEKGVREERAEELVRRAEHLIERTGDEYRAVFMAEYRRLMTRRLGLRTCKTSDSDELYSELLDAMQDIGLDFNHVFRRLGGVTTEELETEEGRKRVAVRLWPKHGIKRNEAEAEERLAKWLGKWRARLLEDWGDGKDEERMAAMKGVNPKFIPRGWILDELVDRVEHKKEREILKNIMTMALSPFEEEWGWDRDEEQRFTGDVPKYKSGMQCSCSS